MKLKAPDRITFTTSGFCPGCGHGVAGRLIAEVAEDHQHHPDIDIRYNKVTLHVTSHDAGGVTARDVALAEAVEHLL